MANWNKQALACAAALMLSACGGGGGGGGGGPVENGGGAGGASAPVVGSDVGGAGAEAPPVVPPLTGLSPPPTPPAPSARVQGTVRFESVPVGPKGGLDYAARFLKLSRGVAIEAVDAFGKSVASGTTDARGHFTLNVPPNQPVVLQIIAVMPGADGTYESGVQVADNADPAVPVWGAVLPAIVPGAEGLTQDIWIPSGWHIDPKTGLNIADPIRPAAPFAILDTIYQSQAKLAAAAPDTRHKPLLVFWSPDNTPAYPIDLFKGQIGSTHFVMAGTQPVILLAGKAEVDTDEYDASVIAHEWAHYYQATQSRNDAVGGAHSTGDALDRNVAFAEGWGDAWSGIALGSARYVDTYGPGQALQVSIDLSAPPVYRPGWFNEDSVRYLLWSLNLASGLEGIAKAFAGPFKTVVASTGIHSFNAALAAVSPSASAVFAPLLVLQGINPKADAWGIGETNNGGSAVALPMVRPLVVGRTPTTGVCVSNLLDPHAHGNKLGDYAYLRFSISNAASYRVVVTGPAGSAPGFEITNAAGPVLRGFSSAATVESASAALPAGDYLIAVNDRLLSSASTCFSVSIQ